MAYATLEPFGIEAEYLGHAITASTVANVNRSKNQKAYSVEDFMPKFEKQNQTPDEMIQIAEMFTMSMGGMDLREDKDDG
jgi:hypothetical protein